MMEGHALLKLVLLDVMEQNHPARWAIAGDSDGDVSPTRAAIELGTTRGYSKYGDTLKLLTMPIQQMEPLGESDYASVPENY